MDPSPIHPPPSASSTTTGYSSSSVASSNLGCGGHGSHHAHPGATTASTTVPVYVTQTSVAVMTSPTLNLGGGGQVKGANGLSASLSSLSPPPPFEEHGTLSHHASDLLGCNTIPRVIVNANGGARVTSGLVDSSTSNLMITRTSRELHHHHYPPPLQPIHPPGEPPGGRNGGGGVNAANAKYFHNFWPSASSMAGSLASARTSRTCLERIVFVLLTLVLVIIFLVAALVFLYLGSSNLDSYSIVFNGGGDAHGDAHGGSRKQVGDAGGGSGYSLNSEEDGIDIVRIKTTEEKVGRPSMHTFVGLGS